MEEGGNFTWNVFVSRMQSTESTSSSVARPGNKLTNWLSKNDKVLKLLQKVKPGSSLRAKKVGLFKFLLIGSQVSVVFL